MEVLSNSMGLTPRNCATAWITSTSVENHFGITAEPDSSCSARKRSSAQRTRSVKSTSMFVSTRPARAACTPLGSDEGTLKSSTAAAISRRPFLSESRSARKRALVYRSGSENVSASNAVTTIRKILVIALFCSGSFAGPTAALKSVTHGNAMSSFTWHMSIIGLIKSAASGIAQSRSRSVRRQAVAGSPSAMRSSCGMSSILGSADTGAAASAVSASSMDIAIALASSSCDGVISSSFVSSSFVSAGGAGVVAFAAVAAASSAAVASSGCVNSHSIAISMDCPRTATSAALACGSEKPISWIDAIIVGDGSKGGGGGGGGGARPRSRRAAAPLAPRLRLGGPSNASTLPVPSRRCRIAAMSTTSTCVGHDLRRPEFQTFISAGSIAACSASANCLAVGDAVGSVMLCSNTAASFLVMIPSRPSTPLTYVSAFLATSFGARNFGSVAVRSVADTDEPMSTATLVSC